MGGRVLPAGRLAGTVAVGLALMGCYTLKPMRGVDPAPGTRLAFDVNDAGRVALGGAMGPEIARVEGRLVQKDSEGYLLAVSNVQLLRGGEQVWSGEQVRLNNQYLGTAYERRFSLGRSIGLGVVGIGGFSAILVSTSLLGFGQDATQKPDTTVTQRLGRP